MRAQLVSASTLSATSLLRCPYLTHRGALEHVAERPYVLLCSWPRRIRSALRTKIFGREAAASRRSAGESGHTL